MNRLTRVSALTCACGLAAGVASAQPYLVNISGATLLENFLTAPASTNDFLDVDNDSAGIEQLAPASGSGPLLSGYWVIQYTAVGSGNGIADLDRRGSARDSMPDAVGGAIVDGDTNYILGTDDRGDTMANNPVDGAGNADEGFTSDNVADAFGNRVQFIDGGNYDTGENTLNPRGYPVRSLRDGSHTAVASTDDMTAGIQIDIAPSDVPIAWFITQSGTGFFNNFPNNTGYGNNTIVSRDFDGTVAGQSNKLKTLVNTNTNTVSPDDRTIYDTAFTLSPVACIINYGTGISEMDLTDVRHTFATGRTKSGENLVAVTRDSGSGTRNGFMNGICLDPSYGMGDNIGLKSSNSFNDQLGPSYIPTNKGGSSRMDATVINTRLGIGHTGAERGINSGWLVRDGSNNSRMDVVAIRNDIFGTPAATFNRPFIDNILDNDADGGYPVLAPSSFATIGDPLAEPMADGGDANGNPAMDNKGAADYMNNVTRSIDAFAGNPGGNPTLFSPGEFIAVNFIPLGATDFVAGPMGSCDPIPAPNLNQSLQDFVRANNVLGESEYASYNTNGRGLVPSRGRADNGDADLIVDINGDGMFDANDQYTDGVAFGANYVNQAGANVLYGSAMPLRNKISGDGNGDGARDITDTADLLAAWWDRNGGPAWVAPAGSGPIAGAAGSDAVIEILFDFNADGNTDTTDVRYFADGLAMVSGSLDRAAGFAAVDNEWFALNGSSNFFGTTLATGAAYEAGDSAGDVAGAAGTTPGFHPVGADGVIDGADIDYVYAQFTDLPGMELDWTDTGAVTTPNRLGDRRDLSADINGDLLVNQDDVCYLVNEILETTLGDINLDGVRDAGDAAIAGALIGSAGGYSDGDVDGDGMVTQNDLDIINGTVADPCGAALSACADVNRNGNAQEPADFTTWLALFNDPANPLAYRADVNNNGNSTEPADFTQWLAYFNNPASDPADCAF